MKIYLDLVILLNFFLDFLLLTSVSLILKRNVRIYKLLLGAFTGGVSILFLFISISSFTLFLIKIIISVLMCLTSFGYKNIKYTFNNIIYLYVKNVRKQKEELSKKYEAQITFLNGKKRLLTAFLDTGNNLYDPYKKRPIMLINKEVLKDYNPRCILVPCMTINKKSMIKCFRVKKIVINKKKIEDEVLIGISDNNFNIDGVDLLLHKKILKGDGFND